jgi:hypothetical protein
MTNKLKKNECLDGRGGRLYVVRADANAGIGNDKLKAEC